MRIKERLLKRSEHTRPGRKKRETTGIVLHWTGNPNAGAGSHRRYFNSLTDRYASYHYIIDWDGTIVRLIPENEIAWHAGPANKTSETLVDRLGQYPNWRTVGIAMCHTDLDTIPPAVFDSAAELTADIAIRHGIPVRNILRHYDCTGKTCPGPMAGEDNADWARFLHSVRAFDDALERIA